MGMFDYVSVKAPLPDGFEGGGFQTKDFDCEMTTIEIGEDGRLRIEDMEWETVPESERPYPDMPFIGSVRPINRRWRDLNHHGMFNFYSGIGSHEAGTWEWHEYNAKFTDGQLVSIDLVASR